MALLPISPMNYLNAHLNDLRVQLRARSHARVFGLAFSSVTLVLVPLDFALDGKPEFGADRPFVFAMATQPKDATIGLVMARTARKHPVSIYTPGETPLGSGLGTIKEENWNEETGSNAECLEIAPKASPLHRRTGQESAEVGNSSGKTVVITGALSYTGKYTTRILLGRRYRIRTLTYHPERENPFADRVQLSYRS